MNKTGIPNVNKLIWIIFLTVKCQLINIEGILESEYLATTMVKNNLVDKHQWMLKLVGKSRNTDIILQSFRVTPHKILTDYKRIREVIETL